MLLNSFEKRTGQRAFTWELPKKIKRVILKNTYGWLLLINCFSNFLKKIQNDKYDYKDPETDFHVTHSLREKCPNTELFLVRIQSEYRKIRTINNSVFGHFSRSD